MSIDRPAASGRIEPALFSFVLAALAVVAGCERAAPQASQPAAVARTASQSSGLRDWVREPPVVEDEADVPALRVLSAAPNVTEICCALGLADRLVGRTRYCTYPPEIEKVRSIGALNDLNVETLPNAAHSGVAHRSHLPLPFLLEV